MLKTLSLVIIALSATLVQPKQMDLADLLTSIHDNWGRQDSEEYVKLLLINVLYKF